MTWGVEENVRERSPTMNAFEAAAAAGREADLQGELSALFDAQNTNSSPDATSIPATFLRVTVTR